ncbi:asparagine synthase (glutamine-hydrolyzing) [Flavobacterium aurantiibacter]|uniref:asparagine synthase (glutamine-hydrolyzing) n=1 Tax=Flavobacterium aurantiibacter TaxID=2023067 RepID=A0A255ZU29_9FLAO|nr:asparagine synthase (glutamine-hydrolyzing) [Flavobacterium aurantiibacter]OYQ44260.1 asparagine synthase (glutamine-hydrolyzing) [Flavobacterium aurantiibacter]
MCGIIGILGAGATREVAEKMVAAQAHRGPDFDAVRQVGENEFLGHNRLSIIDLSGSANQPFESVCRRYTLVFNGEIYNYRELQIQLSTDYTFKTQSDTEVLLAAYIKYGKEVTSYLNGMFSFAVYDAVEKTLFAARDRFGVKPFYYYYANDQFIFSSEIAALFMAGVSKNINYSVWSSYFVYGSYGATDETFWKNIRQLPGGSQLIFRNNAVEIKRWYDFAQRVAEVKLLSEIESSLQIEELLLHATKLRFRADVPVGFNLSGGVDSSTLLGLIKAQNFDESLINVFTFVCNDPRYDELEWVRGMLAGTKFPLHVVPLEYRQVPELFDELSKHQLEPFGGIPTLAYSQIFKNARHLGVKVLLDGQGADEAWAGYDYYLNASDSVIQGTSKSPFRINVLDSEFRSRAEKPAIEKPFESDLKNLQYRDLFHTKLPRALRFNDRVSMLYGTELREPFLDYRLVEYVFAQPYDLKIKCGTQKWLLRQIASKYLDHNIVYAPKRPLQTPQREWLSIELKTWVLEMTECLKTHEFFDGKALVHELDAFFKGDNQSSFHIWQYISSAKLLFP